MKLNREHKDRLFRFIFSNKENLLSLYNALNGTAYNNVEDLEVTTMEDVIYIDMKNDVSFLLDCELNLYEHQSTFNPNLPLRGLLYFGKQYNKYVEKNKCNIYGTKLIELPTPKYVVFFNGKDMEEDKRILRLSDAFSKKEEGCMEVEAIMLNINYGKNREIMDKCHMLKEYAILIDKIKHYSKAYSMEESKYQRIDLHKNFRSRSVVLNTVNEIFEVIMKRSLGNVEYDKDAALYLGNESFPESDRSSKTTELLLYCPETAEEEGASKEEDAVTATKVELEARMVAARIKELVDGETGLQVVDKKSGELRTCGYGDIAILLRSMSGYSDVYLETLKNLGIPVYTDTRTGYFSTFEIRTILQLLKVLDNPRQEIPLTAVMRSMIGGFTAEAMAVIRSRYPDCPWYEAVEAYSGLYEYEDAERNGVQVELSRRLDAFCKKIEKMREKVIYTPIHLLLEEIYEETGFYEYVSVMPNGAQRKDNLDMLVQKALDMEAAQMSIDR